MKRWTAIGGFGCFFMTVGLATLPKWHRSITHCFGFFGNTLVFLAKYLVKERPALDLSRAERVYVHFSCTPLFILRGLAIMLSNAF